MIFLEGKKYDIETLSIDGVSEKGHFYRKIMQKMCSKSTTLYFLSNPVPFNRQNYQKQKDSGTSDQSLFRLQNKFRKTQIRYVLSDQV